jgi:hypothetical protein
MQCTTTLFQLAAEVFLNKWSSIARHFLFMKYMQNLFVSYFFILFSCVGLRMHICVHVCLV